MKRYFRVAIHLLTAMIILFTVLNVPLQRTSAQTAPDADYQILLQHGTIDTRQGETLPQGDLRIDAYQPGVKGYYLVQFLGVIQPEWKIQLEGSGAEVMGYVPNNAYLVRMTGETRSLVAGLPNVQWVGIYQPGYRIAPALAILSTDVDVAQTLTIVTFPNAGFAAINAQVESLGAQILAADESSWEGTLLVQANASLIPALAGINGVMWIEPWRKPVPTNGVARDVMGVEDTVWGVKGLYGAGQTVAVADTGLDVGTTGAAMNDDFEGRIVAAHALGRSATSDWSDPNGHGTHVAGSVLGSGLNSGSDPATHAYTTSHAGVAPEASLVFQSTMAADGNLSGLPVDLNTMFLQAYNDGARIHTNSWGAPQAGVYTTNSYQADQFVWDHPDMTILFAAGNEGIDANADGVVDADSLDSPGTAKNVITVGASENNRPNDGITCVYNACWPGDFPTNPIRDDRVSNNASGMAAFSSRGPADGGRIKPDIVAPGTNILSVRTHQYSAQMNAESGLAGWTADSPWVITNTAPHAGANSWTTGSYGNNVTASLTSPAFDIRTGASVIAYYTTYNLGTGDSGFVEYWNGASWRPCDTVSGSQPAWTYRSCTIDTSGMTAAQLQAVQIRFRLASDASNTGTGWKLDDIIVSPSAWAFLNAVPDLNYIYMGGTSMATPLTAGGAALVREYYTDNNHVPSAALVKATLINGAVDLTPGQYGTGATQEIGARPNGVSGWGRVNLKESLFPDSPMNVLYQDIANANGLPTGQSQVYRYNVQDTSVPFRATLVYTDFPNLPANGGSGITNDLDIEVVTPAGTTVYPNGGTSRDSINNVEDVFIPAANVQKGVYVITIRGQNIPSGPQGYALVVRAGKLSPALRIAVNHAQFDSIGSILTSMGYPWTEIDDSTLNTYANIAQYDIIYTNCSVAALNNGPNAAASLREFVQKGGSLYASDFAYTYISNAFPDYINFFAENPHIGSAGTINAAITDPGLANYLNPASPPTTISLTYDLGGWVPVDTVSSQVTVHIQGNIPTFNGTLNNKPVVVSFAPYSDSGGRVVYTTFHNSAQVSDIEKKLLEYLVLIPVAGRISQEARDVIINNGLNVKQVNLNFINQGVTSTEVSYNMAAQNKLAFVLNWADDSSTLGFSLKQPDGTLYSQSESNSPPLVVIIPDAEAGQWKYQVTGVNVAYDNYPYVVAVGDANPILEPGYLYLPLVSMNSQSQTGFDSQFNGDANNWVVTSGNWYVTSSYYYSYGPIGDWSSTSYSDSFAKVDYQAFLWRYGCESCSFGLVVRGTPSPTNSSTGWNKGYLFLINRNGWYSVYKVNSGSVTALKEWTTSTAIRMGDDWNRLRVVANGNSLAFYVNGTLLWSGSDATFPSGKVGMLFYSDGSSSSSDSMWADWATLTGTYGASGILNVDGSGHEPQPGVVGDPLSDPRGNGLLP